MSQAVAYFLLKAYVKLCPALVNSCHVACVVLSRVLFLIRISLACPPSVASMRDIDTASLLIFGIHKK